MGRTTEKVRTKPVAGEDTPRTDDIITKCCGEVCDDNHRCRGYVVTAHPKYTVGLGVKNKESGKWETVPPTKTWVKKEAARLRRGGHANVGCHYPGGTMRKAEG